MKELYGGSETEILKPKVSSVVIGSLCSEGLPDEADCFAALNMGSFNAENGFGGTQLSSRELGLKEEPGTCNVCVSSFSPCVQTNGIDSNKDK